MESRNQTEEEKILIFPDFDDIKVSTKTFTATTNLHINIDKVFEILPITDYILIPKKRGRKKKVEIEDPNKDLAFGSIVTLKYQGKIRGVDLKQKKTEKNWFRNSFTTVIFLDKMINFKVCRNGTFQMTGCKSAYHAEQCVKIIWNYIKNNPEMYKYTRGTTLEVLFIQCMRNIDFSLGFFVDREKLNRYMKEQTNFCCLLETSFGYTGVSIKVPLREDIRQMPIKKMIYNKEADDNGDELNMWNITDSVYEEYLDTLPPKDKELKINSERYNTFLLFQSGRVIASSMNSTYLRPVYYDFLDVIKKGYDIIEERLDVD